MVATPDRSEINFSLSQGKSFSGLITILSNFPRFHNVSRSTQCDFYQTPPLFVKKMMDVMCEISTPCNLSGNCLMNALL